MSAVNRSMSRCVYVNNSKLHVPIAPLAPHCESVTLSRLPDPLFDDEVFARSAEWKLSTSGLSAGHLFRGTGCVVYFAYSASSLTLIRFGAAYEDGYGINCMFYSSDA